ncbi:hypothetical protein EXIGLDRAFT_767435 [Exidia glandulosa HHB12029]|uniref:Uncharacterized protein n=1 Tax=Exidia glandulosa HHB12029 TaxID=1314781 RepID=A0A165J0I5_EXIGL|nr:hypothetical protein EXIGLDRAFT_767435 [Exidia glandulosa HHB12029]
MIAASSSAKSIASLASVKSLRTFKLDTLRSDLFDAHSVIRTGFAAVTHRRREKKRGANAKTATAPEPIADSPAGLEASSSATSIASSKSLDTFRLDMLSRVGCDAGRTLEAGLAAHRRRDKKRSTNAKTAPAAAAGKLSTLQTKADNPAARRVPAMTSDEMIRSLRLKLHQMRTDLDINASQ